MRDAYLFRRADQTGTEHEALIPAADLTERARAALEQLPTGHVGGLVLVSRRPLRDALGAEERELMFHTRAQLDAPVIQTWEAWSPWRGPNDTSLLDYIEHEIGKISDDFWIDELVTAADAASMAGVAPSTWRSYVSTGRTPPPDGGFLDGPPQARRPQWKRSTIARWMRGRPGPGARTDLADTPTEESS